MELLVIGISGRIESGKDTLCDCIVRAAALQGFRIIRRRFGDAVKREVAGFLTRYTYHEIVDFLTEHCTDPGLLSEILAQTFDVPPRGLRQQIGARLFGHKYGRNYKGLDSDLLESQMHDRVHKEQFRALMQWWSTNYRRDLFDQDYWIDVIKSDIGKQCRVYQQSSRRMLYLIPDVRFPNELGFIQKSLEGFAIRIERPDHEPTTTHVGEHSLSVLDDFNITVINNRCLADLQKVGAVAFLNACSWKWGNAGDAA